jgi:eukaryotic-like serine/threonine-protein kinase
LRAGERYRIARALLSEAAHLAWGGVSTRRRSLQVLKEGTRLARLVTDPSDRAHALGMVALVKGVIAYVHGRWRRSRQFCDKAERIFRDRCTAVTWELDTVQSFSLWSLTNLGDVAQLRQRWAILFKEAEERGDLYAVHNLISNIMAFARLGADEPKQAREELERALCLLDGAKYDVRCHNTLIAQVLIELYVGNGIQAWEHVVSAWPRVKSSLLLRVQVVRTEVWEIRGRCALAAAAAGQHAALRLRDAVGAASRLRREGTHWGGGVASLIEAGVAALRGDQDHAELLLDHAIKDFECAEMGLYGAAARYRRGQIRGGTAGSDEMIEANTWIKAKGVRNPARMVAMLSPGFLMTSV